MTTATGGRATTSAETLTPVHPLTTTAAAPRRLVPMLNTAQVARHLGVDVGTVRRYIKAGDLEAVRVGRSWRVEQGALRGYIEARSRYSTPLTSPR